MTPALLALSRQLAALPGAPEPGLGSAYRGPDGKMRVRDNTGLLWLSDPDQPGSTPLAEERFLLDLADPSGATGGVILALIRPNDRWRIEMSNGYTAHVTVPGDTVFARATKCPALAEACARVLVALGRVGDV